MRKILKFLKENGGIIFGLIGAVCSLILVIFKVKDDIKAKRKEENRPKWEEERRNAHERRWGTQDDKKYEDCPDDEPLYTREEVDKKCKKSYAVGRIHENEKFMEKTKDMIESVYDKGVEAGYNTPGSETYKYSVVGYHNGFKEGMKEGVLVGKTSTLLDMKEPNISNPSQSFIANNYNVVLTKESPENISKMVNENKMDDIKFMMETENKINEMKCKEE